MKISTPNSNSLLALGEDTIGPYYPHAFLDGDRSNLITLHSGLSLKAQGQPIVLRGRIIDSDGQIVDDAVVEFWQANSAGVWRNPRHANDPQLDPYFDGFGRLMTPTEPFEFRTIKPGAIASRDGSPARAPHITLTIFSDGITRLVTQVFFDDEAKLNDADPLLASLPADLRGRLIARRVNLGEDGERAYEITIILRGEGETPFFDDLLS